MQEAPSNRQLTRIVTEVILGFVQSHNIGEGIPARAVGPDKQKGNGIMTLDNIRMDLKLHANLIRKHNKRQQNTNEESGSEKQNGINTQMRLCHTQGPCQHHRTMFR